MNTEVKARVVVVGASPPREGDPSCPFLPIPGILVPSGFLHFPLFSSHAMLPQQILVWVRPAGTHGAAGTGLARFQVISKTDEA